MTSEISIRRRTFLGGVAALGTMHGFRIPAHAAVSPSVGNLPARSNVVIRNTYVMTMEPGQPDLPNGDVHVDNGLIVDVGIGLPALGAQVIDGRGFIVMPGLMLWHQLCTVVMPECSASAEESSVVRANSSCRRAR